MATAMGRKHRSSDRYDRLLGTYGYTGLHVQSTGQSDLLEEDVWPTSPSATTCSNYGAPGDGRQAGGLSLALDGARGDRRRPVGGLSMALDERHGAGSATTCQRRHVDRSRNQHVAAASAPVDVPGWSKLLRVDSADAVGASAELDPDEAVWVPPHEYLERRYGKSVATSVVQGVGRTLKGRDMSRVRDAVWNQTGFFG